MRDAPVGSPNETGINDPITEHIQDFYMPVLVDTRPLVTSGLKAFRLRTRLFRNLDRVSHMLTVDFPINVENGLPVKNEVSGLITSGWMTEFVDTFEDDGLTIAALNANSTPIRVEINTFNYIEAAFLAWDPANNTATAWRGVRGFVDDPRAFWTLRGSTAATLYPVVAPAMVNPNLHSHPPKYGTVLVDQSFTSAKTSWKLEPTMQVGDRIVARIADFKAPLVGRAYSLNGRIIYLGPVADPSAAAASLVSVTMRPGV
jgi:hypothetical protein